MNPVIQAAGLGPPAYSAVPFWIGFWIATAVILLVVALVGSVIMLVNRIEWQAANTVMALNDVEASTRPLEILPTANAHLGAIVRAVAGIAASRRGGGPR